MSARKVAKQLARHRDVEVKAIGLGAWQARLTAAARIASTHWPRIVVIAPGGGRHVVLTGRAAGLVVDIPIVSRVPAEDAADLVAAWLRWES